MEMEKSSRKEIGHSDNRNLPLLLICPKFNFQTVNKSIKQKLDDKSQEVD